MVDPSLPFGAHAPDARAAWAIAQGRRLMPGPMAKTLRSMLLRIAGAKRTGGVFDIEPFPGQRMRAYPGGNISEKWAFCAPQLRDAAERDLLAQAIHAVATPDFIFVDVGANAGFYSLFARSAAAEAGKLLRLVAIEPSAMMRARLVYNLQASGDAEALVVPYAVTAVSGPVQMTSGGQNLGETRVGQGDEVVEGRSLPEIFTEAGLTRVDAMKIDIEGHEHAAFKGLFEQAPRALWPQMILMEISHDTAGAFDLCIANGYRERLRTRLNAVLELAT